MVLFLGENDDCFLLLKKSESILPFFVGQFIDFKLFPRTRETECENLFSKASQKLQCLCDPPEGSNVVQKGKEWDQISDDIIENPGQLIQFLVALNIFVQADFFTIFFSFVICRLHSTLWW